jgi:hypothetical protein
MWKKIAIAGGIGAAVLGGGTAALAVAQDTGTASPATSSSSPSNRPAWAHPARFGARFEHGEWVTKTKSGTQTHDAIQGTVSAVSARSISVKAADGFALTYTVGPDTKVVLRENGKGSAKKGVITDVKTGQHVVVSGVRSSTTIDAKHVVDKGTK